MWTLKQRDTIFTHQTDKNLKAPRYLVLAKMRGQKFPHAAGADVNHHSFWGE